MGLLVWMKREDRVGRIYLLFSFIIAFWGVFFSIAVSENVSAEVSLFSFRIANLSITFLPIAWLKFILMLTGREHRYKKLLKGALALSIFLAIFSFSPWFLPLVEPISNIKYYSKAGVLYFIYTIYFFLSVLLSYFELIKAIKISSETARQGLKGLFIGSGFGFIGGGLAFLPCYDIPMPQYGLFLMPLYPFLTAYSMIRRSLFDLEDLALAVHKDKLAAIGTLAASINHEIRNPLYIIQGSADSFLSLEEEGALSPPGQEKARAHETLKRISEQASRAIDIMKRFAIFSKQSADQEPAFTAVSLSDTFRSIQALAGHEAELEKIKITENLTAGKLKVKADPRHVEQILFNLVVNACQEFKRKIPAGGAEIRIDAEEAGEEIRLRVKDNGAGIPKENLAKIFEPFYTTKSEGTGLGLYVTRQLALKNNARLTVRSEPGQGTTFELIFKKAA